MYQQTFEGTTLLAEITFGLREGYAGRTHHPFELVLQLRRSIESAIERNEPYISFEVTSETTLIHGHTSGTATTEPAVKLRCQKSLKYDVEKTDQEWQTLVENTVAKLAAVFNQFEFHVAYSQVYAKVFQRQKEEGR